MDEPVVGYFVVEVAGSTRSVVHRTAADYSSEEVHHHSHCNPVVDTGHKEGAGKAADWDRSYMAVVQDYRVPQQMMTCCP